MVYRKTKQKVRRIYSRSKSIFGGDLLKNPIIVGIAAGVAKNALAGKKIIDIENIKSRISKMDGTNPLVFLGLGLAAKNPLLTAIGLFGIIDPPDEKKEEYIGYSNIGENEESTGYSNIGEGQESAEYSNVGENEESVGYSNVGESRESVDYSNIGETQKIEPKKRFVY